MFWLGFCGGVVFVLVGSLAVVLYLFRKSEDI